MCRSVLLDREKSNRGTSLGSDNTGYLNIFPDCEIEEGTFNTSNSNLWTKVLEYFAKDLKEEWSKMRQKNFTLDNLMKYVYDEQIAVIPARYQNVDAQKKYLNFGSLYTYCCHGSKHHHVKRWLRERIAYVDSMLEYFTSQHEQIIMRMNKTGAVEFNVTSYIPLYFSVKWSNAQGGIQTIKVKRNESVRFFYNSTTSTDQEVIVYHSKQVKRLDNLSNLNLSSCLLANANKLTEVEIHSPLLYNINVTENKFLRKLDLSGCTALGTVVAVGTTLDLSKCNYLKTVNTYGTSLTEVIFNTSGGSLRDIYYPTTLQALTLIKQPLLQTVGLPYGLSGEEVPRALYSVNIRDCTAITKLNTSTSSAINTTMASMTYCNNLTIRNSLKIKTLSFDGFKRLRNVIVENMEELEKIAFDNMLSVGQAGTIGYIGLSNCPKITAITMNCTSNAYEITFLDNAILDFGKLGALKRISSNCVVKGLKTIIVPRQLTDLDFKTTYGTGTSSVANIWVSDQCNVNTSGTTVTATHINPSYEGLDFKNMQIKTLDMAGFGMVKNGINFHIVPTTTNPNLNTLRDGSVTKPWFRPSGSIDLRNYEGEFRGIFKGLDLDKVSIILEDGTIEDADISSLFEGTIFENATMVNSIIAKFPNATNLNYIFANSDLADASKIVFPKNRFTLKGGFKGSKLTSDFSLPLNVVDVSECFMNCANMKYATANWKKQFSYTIATTGCYYNSVNIESIDGISGTIHDIPYEWGGHGFSIVNSGTYTIEVPENNYRVTFGDIMLDGTVDWGDGAYTHGVSSHTYENAGVYTVKGKIIVNNAGLPPHSSLASILLNVVGLPTSFYNFENVFNNCQFLKSINLSRTDTSKVTTTRQMFKGCISLVLPPEIDLSSVVNIEGMYEGCTGIIELKFKNLSQGNVNCANVVSGCSKLTTIGFTGNTNKISARALINEVNALISANSISLVALSNEVRDSSNKIEEINVSQQIQDIDIVINLLASTDIFEMLTMHIAESTGNLFATSKLNSLKGGENMVMVYVSLISKGLKTINDVPVNLRPAVLEELAKIGLDGYGKPLK